MTGTTAGDLSVHIRDVPDFPKPGVLYKDITPLLGDAVALGSCVRALADPFADHGVDKVVGIEARGFMFAPSVALQLGAGFVPVRKAGKLPWAVVSEAYGLEYGNDIVQIHRDGLCPGERVLIVDDVLATGGTAGAGVRLVEALGGTVAGFACVIELAFLGGRGRLAGVDVVSLITYQ